MHSEYIRRTKYTPHGTLYAHDTDKKTEARITYYLWYIRCSLGWECIFVVVLVRALWLVG